jgi:hypothetical protein
MMTYLDWSQAEDDRIEAQVALELEDNTLGTKRRGVDDVGKE